MKKIEYFTTMQAELKADCYCGDNCDGIEPLWDIYCDGDKEGSEDQEPIVIDPKLFPYGTKVTVEVPCCPECCLPAECSDKCDCGFDWREWVENQYS